MNRNARLLAGGLASAAVASAVTLTAPTAYAADGADRPCGQPVVPAVFVTVITEPVLRLVPAITHDEWRWQRDVTTFEQEFSRLVSPAGTETDWVRSGTVEHLWAHKVVDQVAVDAVAGTPEKGHVDTVVVTAAVTATLFEYVQQQTGHTRWERADWNTQNGNADTGKGWTRTGASREDVVTEAVTEEVWVVDQAAVPGTPASPEISHLEYSWAETSPGSGWTGPVDSRTVGGGETTTTTGDDVPSGLGWAKAATREVPAVVDTVWADGAPDGYAATGASRVKHVTTEQTGDPSATAPEGDGWSQVAESRVVVVDVPETTELVSRGSVVQAEVSPEIPGTPACPEASPGLGGSVVSPADADAQTGHHAVKPAKNHAGGQAQGAAAAASTVLPAAGSPVSPLLVTAGLSALLAGGVLVRIGRRSRTI
jgi:hypothetical protein